VIERLIAGNERAMLAWDKAVRGEHGGAREGAGRKPAVAADAPPHDPETGEIKGYIIPLEKQVSKGTGTSAQLGLRRLEKAATAGDGNAADLLRRVVNPDDAMTVNGACVAMGWRKPMPANWCGNWTRHRQVAHAKMSATSRTNSPKLTL